MVLPVVGGVVVVGWTVVPVLALVVASAGGPARVGVEGAGVVPAGSVALAAVGPGVVLGTACVPPLPSPWLAVETMGALVPDGCCVEGACVGACVAVVGPTRPGSPGWLAGA